MRKFSRLPFSPHYKFKCLRDFNYDGKDYKSGEPFPEDGKEVGEGLLFKLYDQRRIEPIPPEATIEILENQTPPDGTGEQGGENPPNENDGSAPNEGDAPNENDAPDENANDSSGENQTPPDENGAENQEQGAGAEQSNPQPVTFTKPYSKTHKGFGRYDVLDAAGLEVAVDLKKAEAELLVAQNVIG